MKLSVGSWAFSFGPYAGDPIPFAKIVERLAEAGFEVEELGIERFGRKVFARLGLLERSILYVVRVPANAKGAEQ